TRQRKRKRCSAKQPEDMLEFHGDGLRNVPTQCQALNLRMSKDVTLQLPVIIGTPEHCMPGSQGQVAAATAQGVFRSSLRANGSRERAPDDRLREAIHVTPKRKYGLLRRFAPPP